MPDRPEAVKPTEAPDEAGTDPSGAPDGPEAGRADPRYLETRVLALLWPTLAVLVVVLVGVIWTELRRTEPPELPKVLYRIPINQADAGTLQLLPYIGPTLADRIVASRERDGPFRRPADLRRVNGIGEKIAERMAPYIHFQTVPPEGAAAGD